MAIAFERKPMYEYTELVAKHSKSLATLVSGSMAESKKHCAQFEDVAEGAFVRFVQFLYTGDYDAPDPDIVLAAEDIEVDGDRTVDEASEEATDELNGTSEPRMVELAEAPPSAPVSEDDNRRIPRKKDKKSKKKSRMNGWRDESPMEELRRPSSSAIIVPQPCKKDLAWSAFSEEAVVRLTASWEPRENTEASEDYTSVFLAHAQLYILSDKHSIEPLRDLALQKLRLTLTRFQLFKRRIPDIVELVRYTYEHTMDHEKGIDKLRSLVMDYVVCHVEDFVKNEGFQEILQEEGALGKDLMVKVVKRLD